MKENDFNEIYKRNYRRSFLFVKSYVHDDMANLNDRELSISSLI